MKCRIPQRTQMPRLDMQKAREFLHEEAQRIVEEKSNAATRRNLKLLAYSINRRYGFGKGRIMELLMFFNKTIEEGEANPDFWRHLDAVVIDEIGIEFDREEYE